jgi:hypothetical protein
VIEALIVISAIGAAAYLLAPLRGGPRRGGRLLLLLMPALLGVAHPRAASALEEAPSIGLLLIAVDAQRDHLRISEALRLVNPGAPRGLDLTLTLPPGALYLTVHRGMDGVRRQPGGFSGRIALGRGAHEVIYSYALPAGREQRLSRSFPLRARRVEIVVRGPRVRVAASRGAALPPIELGGASLPRWEARDIGPGEALEVELGGLPVSRPWFPRAVAAAFAVLLAGGLGAGARGRVSPVRREVEESPPVRRT